ncbi:uncharacterized protein Z518_07312 [Rhinocladiella mackenziei CBS 650.93]|uniref:SMP-30/Gluconolactonase/LRE-like region domain-containing protein n=1 Tax=Rhinocladiella mackenziei CBS 650.93 TaxID=1442369 RepID=A0A0D2ID39_9EURO|nr:uncharacterized protein Z518_07312 [Rhinocladiella mackenziei CBS 650.93]KIX03759.1 hypothetical protein Z518_07312 [Rhinocladiella mackenziei CBS 650.93]
MPSLPLEPVLIHDFPLGTYVNSLAIRKQDGDILVTLASIPQVYLISTRDEFEATKVATIPGVQAALSIVETQVNEFYVVAGNLSVTEKTSEKGSYSVWKLDMRKKDRSVEPAKVADVTDAALLDKATPLDSTRLLIPDSILGSVWMLNIKSGQSRVVLNDTASMSPVTPSGVGINSVGIHGDFLYYDNSQKGSISRVPIDLQTATPVGPVEPLFQNNDTVFAQGFAFRGNSLWLANGFDEINLFSGATSPQISTPLATEVVAGSPNETTFVGPSDCKFGRKPLDLKRGSLYVTTTGKSSEGYVYGGSLFRVDLGPHLS